MVAAGGSYIEDAGGGGGGTRLKLMTLTGKGFGGFDFFMCLYSGECLWRAVGAVRVRDAIIPHRGISG